MYVPEQQIIAKMTAIQREILLPEEAVGRVLVAEGQTVDIREVVARGFIPDQHLILETRSLFGALKDDDLKKLLLVKERQPVQAQQPIAGKDPRRGRRLLAPVNGMIVYVGGGRIIMQATPQFIDLEAGVRGTVSRVYPGRGVAVETTGALVQGVWGSGKTVIATLRMEPPTGIDTIPLEALDTTYKNEIVVTTHPLTPQSLRVAEARNFAGLVAPSMPIQLINRVAQLEKAVLLTEGFGTIPMNEMAVTALKDFDSYQAVLDAYLPRRWEARRPELVIHRRTEDTLTPPDFRQTLRRGMRVRITRAPYTGQIGKISDLPERPLALENGLAVPVARVDLVSGTVEIPLANLELSGT